MAGTFQEEWARSMVRRGHARRKPPIATSDVRSPKAPVDRDRLWRYRKLGLLPHGTLGREYWMHMTQVGFGFPGEPGGIADVAAYHDVAHVWPLMEMPIEEARAKCGLIPA